MDTNINWRKIDLDLVNLISKEDLCIGTGSGFGLQSIDGPLLSVYNYISIGGLS